MSNVIIPDSVTRIGAGAFSICTNLTNVTIPDSVTRIGYSAFDGCSDALFDTTTIPGVKLVDGWVIDYADSLSGNLDLTGVRGIGDRAFSNCFGLTSVTMPDGVTNIGGGAFDGCGNLSSVMFQGDCPQNVASNIYEGTRNDLTTYVSRYANGWGAALSAGTWNGRPIALLDLADDEPPFDCIENPDGTVTLKEYRGIAADEIYIPSSIGGLAVSAVTGHAFESCAGLRSVTIPATVTWLDDEVFAGCSSLVSVTYLGDAPDTGNDIYKGTPRTLVSYVVGGTIGWSGGISTDVPGIWNDRGITCEWTVTFDVNGGTVAEPSRVVTNECAVGELPVPTCDGHTFDGWYTASEGGVAVTATTVVTANVAFYAHWTAVVVPPGPEPVVTQQVWTVTFDANGGEGTMAAQMFTNGVAQALSANAFTRFGYDFAGWATSADGEVVCANGQLVAVTSGQMLYARWAEIVAGRLDTGFAKAQTVLGALYGRDGVPVGSVQIKAGKVNKKKGSVKISATATLLVDGKAQKVTAKAVNVDVASPVAAGTAAPHTAVNVVFKAPIGEMAFEMESDGTFRLKNDRYLMAEKKVGGDWSKVGAKVYVVTSERLAGTLALPEGTIEELLPDGEPVIPKAGKWLFAKATGVKYVKDKATGGFSLAVDEAKGTNRSAMKLSYTPMTGIFKVSF